jgi:hypothetical protein
MLSFTRPISTPSLAFIRFRPLTVPTFTRQFATAMTSSRLSFRPLDRTTAKGKLSEDFGRKVVGYDPASATQQEIEEIQNALYSVSHNSGFRCATLIQLPLPPARSTSL